MEDKPLPINTLEDSKTNPNKKHIIYIIVFFVLFLIFYYLFLSAPKNFPSGASVTIEHGMSLRSVSLKLKDQQIIRSRIAFEAFVIIFDKEKGIISTNYYFENKLPVYKIAERMVRGRHEMAPISVTVPEGFDVNQIADAFAGKLINFNKSEFLFLARDLEGYLFPDTYFFLNTEGEKEVVASMGKNFEKKIAPLLPEIAVSGKSEKKIIVMASIIEREAKGDADRDIISGILWKRISIGMPLQVDAAPDTYKTKGLPPSPICNAGLESIKAAIHPQSTSYLYYLHDKDGRIHYAKTFAEHIKNKLEYLKS